MATLTDENSPVETAFGITTRKIRGAVAIFIIGVAFYLVLFESDPPPAFDEVQIYVPNKPDHDFNERTIVQPEFEASPSAVKQETGEGVEITIPEKQKTPKIEAVPATKLTETPLLRKVEAKTADKPKSTPTPTSTPKPIPTPTATPTLAGNIFYVQILASVSREKAEQLASAAGKKLEVPFIVTERSSEGKIIYRALLGPFKDDEARARNALSRLLKIQPTSGAFVIAE